MGTDSSLAVYEHPILGKCSLLRIEGVNWIIRSDADNRLHRIPPGSRGAFRRAYTGTESTIKTDRKPPLEVRSLSPNEILATIEHPDFGVGDIIRVEVSDWIIRFRASGRSQRFPLNARRRIKVIADFTAGSQFGGTKPAIPDTRSLDKQETKSQGIVETKSTATDLPDLKQSVTRFTANDTIEISISEPAVNSDRRRGLRIIESLRNGLPPMDAFKLGLCIGQSELHRIVDSILVDTDQIGGAAVVIRGSYGQGKSFALKQAVEAGIAGGYAVIQTEIDSIENRLNYPHQIYHNLMSTFRVVDEPTSGLAAIKKIISKAQAELGVADISYGYSRIKRIEDKIQCGPLAWLLSDPNLVEKQLLLDLCMAQPGINASSARKAHMLASPPQVWPSFSATTQGDFASYLLSGWGRICRIAGYKGLLIALDEMERWEDLNWRQQTLAGNLLGGLIWSATAENGQRLDSCMPEGLSHSARAGGFPFNTPDRCHMGLIIAMTPRGQSGPENEWKKFGKINVHDLPSPSEDGIRTFCRKIAPYFAFSRSMTQLDTKLISSVSDDAVSRWLRAGDFSMRSGIVSVVESFDELFVSAV